MLELIDKGSATEAHPAPSFRSRGISWRVVLGRTFPRLFRGQGLSRFGRQLSWPWSSPTPKPLRTCSIADYVSDVDSVADNLPTRPVVIGHSVGGFVVQKYLDSCAAPAAVLIASVPPQGSFGFALRKFRRHPWLMTRAMITGMSLSTVNTPELARESFFSAHTPESEVVRYAAQLQEESARAIPDMMRNLPKPEHVNTRLVVLGAECDGLLATKEVRATARAYRTEAEIFPDMGHDMMLEPGWQAVAERIDSWLTAQGL